MPHWRQATVVSDFACRSRPEIQSASKEVQSGQGDCATNFEPDLNFNILSKMKIGLPGVVNM